MTKEELEKAIQTRIDIPDGKLWKSVQEFWEDFSQTVESPFKAYQFWKRVAATYPHVETGTWGTNGNIFHPYLEKKA